MDKKKIDIPEETLRSLQELLNLIAYRVHVPSALVMRIDPPDIKVFISSESKGNPYKVGDSECLFDSGLYCERVFKTREKLLVPNALKDKEWNKNPDIKLGMISYLGFPIFWPDREVFGTICVLDSKENYYKEEYEDLILQVKKYIEAYLDLLLSKFLLKNKLVDSKKSKQEIREKDLYCDDLFVKLEKLLHKK